MSQIKFTWEAYEYKGKDLSIKLNFTNATLISPLYEQDSLFVEIIDPKQNVPIFFYSSELQQNLDKKSWKMVSKLRK